MFIAYLALLMYTHSLAHVRAHMYRVGQNHICIYIHTVNIRYYLQENHQIYGHVQCIGVYGSGQPYICVKHWHEKCMA
jgi:hypothetical protein